MHDEYYKKMTQEVTPDMIPDDEEDQESIFQVDVSDGDRKSVV